MIPNVGELLVKQSRYDAQQNAKNKWRKQRMIARDFYNGDTKSYTHKYFSTSLLSKVPIANVNVTKRVIDRTSCIYETTKERVFKREYPYGISRERL